MAGLAAGVLVQLSSSEESSDEQDSEDDITSSASCSGMSKSTPLSERGDMDSSSSTSVFTSAKYLNLYCSIQKLTLYCMSIIEFYGHNSEHNGLFF